MSARRTGCLHYIRRTIEFRRADPQPQLRQQTHKPARFALRLFAEFGAPEQPDETDPAMLCSTAFEA